MRNTQEMNDSLNKTITSENYTVYRSLDRIPICAPTLERAIDTARTILDIFQDKMSDDMYRSRIEAAWRAARGAQRWILAGRNRAELMLALEEFVFEEKFAASGTRHGGDRQVTFVFSGMGPQWSGMGRNLAENIPRFFEHIKSIDKLFIEHTGESVWEELERHEGSDVLPTALAQMANFLIQAALYHLLLDEGITPVAVLGHSAGEAAAAYAAGVYSLEEAVKVSVVRGKLQASLAGRGSMLAVGMGHQKALELIENIQDVSIAAVNDDNSVTLAGSTEEIMKLEKHLAEEQVFVKMLRVEVPYHSPVMDEITDSIVSQLSFLKPDELNVRLYSSVMGKESEGKDWGPDYWAKNVRQPVLFAESIKTALRDGSNCFIEISPHPVLAQSMDSLCSGQSGVSIHHLLSRRDKEYNVFVSQICELAIDSVGRPPRVKSAPLLKPVLSTQQLWDEDPEAMAYRRGLLATEGVRLLGRRSPSVAPMYELEISTTDYPWIAGHNVLGLGSIVPATLWAELMALVTTVGQRHPVSLVNLMIIQALPVTSNVTVILSKIEGGVVKCLSRPSGKSSEWTLHALASLAAHDEMQKTGDEHESLQVMPEQKGIQVDSDQLYAMFRFKGLEYSHYFKNLSEVVIGDEWEAWASVDSTEEFTDGLHSPWILDAGLQLLIAAVKDWSELMYLPYKIGRINLIKPLSAKGKYKLYAKVSVATDAELIGAVYFYNSDGQLLAEFDEITCIRNMSDDVERSNYLDRHSYTLRDLTPELLSEFIDQYDSEETSDTNIDLDDEQSQNEEVFQKLDEYWIADGDSAIRSKLFERPIITYDSIGDGQKVHLLWEVPMKELRSDTWQTVQLIQNVAKLSKKSITLTIIANHEQHWLFGMRRSAANAYGLEIRVVMRDESTTLAMLEAAVALVAEHEIVFKGDEPLFKRLEKVTGQALRILDKSDEDKSELPDSTLFFDFTRGSLQSMMAVREPLRRPKKGEVTIKVAAVGVAWKDIGKILGTIGTALINTHGGQYPGSGVAGVVIEAGPDAPFSVGERIYGAIKRSFRKHITVTKEELVDFRRIADHITNEVVVSHALPWMTSFAVFDRADPQPGEKVFVQSGAGAVGSIMRLYLKQFGVQVVTSVGTEEKMTQLKSEDPDLEVVLARGNAIPSALIEAGYRGFDWIIATVSGAASVALLSLLNNRGQYFHLGKAASVEESFLVNAFDGNRSFQFVDVDQLMARETGWFSRMVTKYTNTISNPANAMPLTKYRISELPQVYNKMAQGETTGCIAIEVDDEYSLPVVNAVYNNILPDGQYLITGGYGAVGLICAQWLVSRGARNIVLSGSSGQPNESAQATIELLKAGGVSVKVMKSDAADRESVQDLINRMVDSGERIRGVIHAAGMISDGPFDAIDEARIERSFGPKLEGAHHLVSALETTDTLSNLDFFLFTSSISSVIGLTIQGTYASANSGLDGIAEQLRQRGVQACAIQLGPVGQSGMASEEVVERYFTTIGLTAIEPRRLFGVMDLAVAATVPHFVIDDVVWARNGRAEPANATSSIVRHIVQEAMSSEGKSGLGNLISLDHKERTEVLTEALIGIITEAIGVEKGYLSADSNFSSLGIDSLAIMEVQAGINQMLNQELPLTRLFTQDGTIVQLADRISEYLAESSDGEGQNEETITQDQQEEAMA